MLFTLTKKEQFVMALSLFKKAQTLNFLLINASSNINHQL